MNGIIRVIKPGKFNLKDIPTSSTGGLDKESAKIQLDKLGAELNDLEDWLFAAKKHSVLVILQGRDTSGKDGTIRGLFTYLNALSHHVASFGVPSEPELARDFLWRVHQAVPAKGSLVFFNRSHYEDVLVVRAKKLVAESVWRPRFDMINHFEDLLVQNGTIILKFFLHISKNEQKKRLLAREQEPEKAWKLNPGDWEQRKLWSQFTHAYEEVFERCSPKTAPWHIVPADHKWHRNLAVLRTIVETLRPLKPGWTKSMEAMGRERLAALRAYRADNKLE